MSAMSSGACRRPLRGERRKSRDETGQLGSNGLLVDRPAPIEYLLGSGDL